MTDEPENTGPQEASPEVKAYLEGVVGVVEATSFEKMCLWQESQRHGREWVEILHGYGPCVGSFNGRPVCISLMSAVIDGQKVAFIHATSQIVDWTLIDKWLEKNLPETAFRAPSRINRTDAMNFHNIFPATPRALPVKPAGNADALAGCSRGKEEAMPETLIDDGCPL